MPKLVRFDCFEIDLAAGRLFKRGLKIGLPGQSFHILASLLECPGEVVTREDLRRRLWPGEVFVDYENSLNTAVARLREALGDSAERPRFIETLPRRGYRFIAELRSPSPTAHQSKSRVRLLVLPFLNLSGDPAQEYFSDAITDEIITAIAGLAPEQLAVIARTTAMRYKGTHKDVERIGRELNVDYIIEGGVRHVGDQVTVNVQLIETNDQTHLFARRYDASLPDIFNMQDSIAQDIAERVPGVGHSVGSGRLRAAKKPTEDLAAYNEYIQGRHYMASISPASWVPAQQHFERAIARDSEFALAHDALAELHWYFGYFGLVAPRDAFAAGIVHALRAIEIDNTRAETHALLGQFHKTVEYNWPDVHREMALALQLDPNSPVVRMRYAVSELMPHGRLDEAVAELERALELDPLSLLTRMWLGIILLLSRRFERALEVGRKLLELDPAYVPAHFVVAHGYRYLGRLDEAIEAQTKAVELSGGIAMMLGWLGLTLAGSGRTDEARQVLQQLRKMAETGYVPPTSVAWIHIGLREIDIAFEWMNRAVEECDQVMMPIKSYAFLDPLRADPRFAALLRKMNLES